MLRFFNKRLHNRKGFTLIELIVVIAILAILAMIAIPAYSTYRTNSRIAANEATAKIVYDAMMVSDAANDDDGVAWANFIEANTRPAAADVAIAGTIDLGTLVVTVSTGGAAFAGVYPQ